MYRKWISGLVIALILLWGGVAMAQLDGTSCNFEGDPKHLLTFPYSIHQDFKPGKWWGGIAIINTSGTEVKQSDLCYVAYEQNSRTPLTAGATAELPGNGMIVNILDDFGSSWSNKRMTIGVFTNDETINANQLRGFGMVGNMVEGQGYLALQGDNVTGNQKIEFPYVPNSSRGLWWRGLSIFNNAGEAQTLTVTIYYAEGGTPVTETLQLAKDELFVGMLDRDPARSIFPNMDPEKRARIVIEGDKGPIFGFAMFGNEKEAQGLVAPN